jgi:hypothetical protein
MAANKAQDCICSRFWTLELETGIRHFKNSKTDKQNVRSGIVFTNQVCGISFGRAQKVQMDVCATAAGDLTIPNTLALVSRC